MVSLRRHSHSLSSREIREIELEFPNLGQVVACYLYQSWESDYANSMDALRDAKERQPKDQIDRAVIEIDQLLSKDLDDDSLSAVLAAMAGGGGPETRETSAWLAQARRILSAEDVK